MSWRLFLPKTVTVLRQGYGPSDVQADLIAGLTVAIVALPLAMALAIASGTTPDKGLVTAIVAGFLISLLGGSRFQIGGPTGAFVVIVYGVIAHHGYDGLLMATIMAGLILVIAGLARLGTLIKYIPDPVTTGFTSGIAAIILVGQLGDLMGLKLVSAPAELLPRLAALWDARESFNPVAAGVGAACLGAILLLRRWAPRWPGFLIATLAAAAAVWALQLPVETIGSRFGGIGGAIEAPRLDFWSWDKVEAVFPSALTIALLAGIESLLSAVVADQMTGRRHRSNVELVAQGVANIASALFGGIPATGAIARTATNIRAGARSPVAGMAHALLLLVFLLALAKLLALAPLTALSAVLVVIALNMAEVPRFRLLLAASAGDRAVLLVTFGLTMFADLTVAIAVGMVLASFIFMHRMSRLVAVETGEQLFQRDVEDGSAATPYAPNFGLPPEVGVLSFRGPLFFGGATVLKDALENIGARKRCFILRFDETPMVDPTGAHALEDFLVRSLRDGEVVISGAAPTVVKSLKAAISDAVIGRVRFTDDFEAAAAFAVEAARAPA
jgi:SulP family sulfate permease